MKHFFFLGMMLVLQSCMQVGTDEFSTFMIKELDLNGPISFNDLKTNILTPKQCLSCHSDFNTEEGLSFYLKAGVPEESLLYTVLVTGSMPKNAPPLSINNIAYVKRYIQLIGDAPVTPGGGTADGKISFNEFKRDFLIPGKCLTCHAEFANEAGINEHIAAGDPEASLLYTIVESGQMPKNNPALSADKINYLKNYILALNSAPTTPQPQPPLPLPTDGVISFELFKSNFLAPNKCLTCHADFSTESGVNQYINGGSPETSLLYKVVKNGQMPKNNPPLSQDKIDYLKSYILALSSAPSNPPPLTLPPDGIVTFALLKTNFLAPNKCLNCHKGFSIEENFNKHIEPQDPKKSKAYKLVVKGKMPQNGPPLSQDKINYLKAYIMNLNPNDEDD
jgi:nitrate reductase cytochrome c-type subunit